MGSFTLLVSGNACARVPVGQLKVRFRGHGVHEESSGIMDEKNFGKINLAPVKSCRRCLIQTSQFHPVSFSITDGCSKELMLAPVAADQWPVSGCRWPVVAGGGRRVVIWSQIHRQVPTQTNNHSLSIHCPCLPWTLEPCHEEPLAIWFSLLQPGTIYLSNLLLYKSRECHSYKHVSGRALAALLAA